MCSLRIFRITAGIENKNLENQGGRLRSDRALFLLRDLLRDLASPRGCNMSGERPNPNEKESVSGSSPGGASQDPSPVAAFIAQAAASLEVPRERRGRYCCVVGCSNNQRRDGARGIKFHQFPSDPVRRKEWNRAVNRTIEGRPTGIKRGNSVKNG